MDDGWPGTREGADLSKARSKDWSGLSSLLGRCGYTVAGIEGANSCLALMLKNNSAPPSLRLGAFDQTILKIGRSRHMITIGVDLFSNMSSNL